MSHSAGVRIADIVDQETDFAIRKGTTIPSTMSASYRSLSDKGRLTYNYLPNLTHRSE
jgi:hypothetical protein